MKLSIKQALPTSLDDFIADNKIGDTVSGRVVELTATGAIVELGEGIRGACRTGGTPAAETALPEAQPAARADLSSLSSMLQARWKGAASAAGTGPEPLAEGQVRSFKIKKMDAEAKKIEVELA